MVNHVHVAGYFLEAYKGYVKVDKRRRSVIDIATGREMPAILKRFGDWVVTTEGIDNLVVTYEIGKTRFNEKLGDVSWIEHMKEKEWCDIGDFDRALTAGKDFVKYGII